MSQPILDEFSSDDLTELASDTVRVGRMWAHHGLQIAESALQASAETLQVVARSLGKLAEAFQQRQSG